MEEAGSGALTAGSGVLESVVNEAQQQQPAVAGPAAAVVAEGAAMGMQAAEACAETVSGMWPPPSVDWHAMVRSETFIKLPHNTVSPPPHPPVPR